MSTLFSTIVLKGLPTQALILAACQGQLLSQALRGRFRGSVDAYLPLAVRPSHLCRPNKSVPELDMHASWPLQATVGLVVDDENILTWCRVEIADPQIAVP
eukprot:CAMPEP_0204070814 /NCGR_PEP_ID=MMETSP0360-20130528/159096_1 /ASSEMBLY_ACC=CAM_ASM_000342 /TAXON_ID=268821 /ORGANISM="Scrippsiella Hangoei, Strain SHTV-5" /LENGTH=100 /DNA_ID=CAMNT_0051019051 /DNA_START=323 /DNA_END=625 /DNA_ORIENTATION=+